MRLLKVNTPCSGLVPEIRDGIESQDIRPMEDVKEKYFNYFEKNLVVSVVEIYLVS